MYLPRIDECARRNRLNIKNILVYVSLDASCSSIYFRRRYQKKLGEATNKLSCAKNK
jgi:hypothetical protein